MEDIIARYAKMVEQFPNNELARFSLGKALFDTGKFVEAREQFATALTKKPDWMVVQILLGKCESSLGNKTAAKAAFAKGRELAVAQNHEGPLAEVEQLLADLEAA